MKRYLAKLFIGFSLLAITACGFHLRGSADLPMSLQTMYVQGVNMQQGLGTEKLPVANHRLEISSAKSQMPLLILTWNCSMPDISGRKII